MDIFKKLEQLKFPKGEYVVIGSGTMAALGIREANDLDILVTEKLFKTLKASKKNQLITKGAKYYLDNEDVEIYYKLDVKGYNTSEEDAISSALIISGYPFLNISETIKFKKAYVRDKDKNDIELINKYLLNTSLY